MQREEKRRPNLSGYQKKNCPPHFGPDEDRLGSSRRSRRDQRPAHITFRRLRRIQNDDSRRNSGTRRLPQAYRRPPPTPKDETRRTKEERTGARCRTPSEAL